MRIFPFMNTEKSIFVPEPKIVFQDECSAIGGADSGDNGDKEGKKKKNRCLSCKKKVGLTGEIDR